MADLEKVLGPARSDKAMPEDSASEEASEPEGDVYMDKLKELMGGDEAKAADLRDIICGLARQEMMESDEEPEDKGGKMMPGHGPKKKGLAIILGGG